ncbi:transposase [Jeotgalibacillus salarius]|uniref:Transposase n=2 Tax=Jeotgalibacillus salarius TaxID=546023 RepID=A0A4Y8LMJ1_9BACL|nr:transposase [Jeotgalibacillus salarius]
MSEMEKNKKAKSPKRQQNIVFKQLWVILSKIVPTWKDHLFNVQPETVIRWHRTAFKIYWRRKSKKMGRPLISIETILLIEKLHKENPTLSSEKLHEQIKLRGVINTPAPNTIAKYIKNMANQPKPPSKKQIQSWNTFIKNHLSVTWAVDFFTIPTFNFKILHVLVIIHHQTRRIIHFNVTTNPDAEWVVQQFRHATPYGERPTYLIHDNDPLFRSNKCQRFLQTSGIQSKKTAYKSPWQNAYVERAIGTIKRECTNHIIPINEKHIHHLLHDYISNYYNTDRTHQGIGGQTPIPTPKHVPVKEGDLKLKATPVMNGLYHTYKRIA